MTTTTATATTRQDEERLFNLDLIQRTLGTVWREAPCPANIVFGNSVFWTETSGEDTRWLLCAEKIEPQSWSGFVKKALEAMSSPTFVLYVTTRSPSSNRETTTTLTWMDTYSAAYCKHRLHEALHESDSRADVIAVLEIALARYALESSISGWNEYDIIDHIRLQVNFGDNDGYKWHGHQRSLHFVAFVLPLLYGIEAGFTRSLFTYMATRPEHTWADNIGCDLRVAFLESERQYDDATIEFAVTHPEQPALAYVNREPFDEAPSDIPEPFIFTSGPNAARRDSSPDDGDVEKRIISPVDRSTLDQLLVAARLKRDATGFATNAPLVSFFDGEHSHLGDISMSQTYLAQALDEFTCLDEPTAQTTMIVEAACSTLIDVVATRYAHLLDKDESIGDILWRLRLALDTARALHHQHHSDNANNIATADLEVQTMCI